MPHKIKRGHHRHHSCRHHIHHHRQHKASRDKHRRGPWIPPRQQRLNPFSLRRRIPKHRLQSRSHSPHPLIPRPHCLLSLHTRHCIEFLIQLFPLCPFRL
ncbi:hypothetical protein IEQ34_012777 [Dendrobium chrysotoxum]|uniref:Uncharacterized protein n=1 Tax=Dendrobium chrysotoxum TaxID=161865 RepID=A0AAV7GN60_DENCH|nr:hypothetical protein IEQ34_012777 [Dendrobium chrysotoxum]